ncbi:TIGR02270 family protein [Rhizobacter sp. P5_C2]
MAFGFEPAETSARVNERVVDLHADESAFLWSRRRHAARSPRYRLKDLRDLDERIEAHLDGLRAAGAAGLGACAALESSEDKTFVFAVTAFASEQREAMSQAIRLGESAQDRVPSLAEALAWLPLPWASIPISKLRSSPVEEHREVAMRALVAHGQDPEDLLDQGLSASSPSWRAVAYTSCADLRHRDRVPALLHGLRDPLQSGRDAAALALTRMGDPDGLNTLRRLCAEPGSEPSTEVVQTYLRACGRDEGRAWIRAWASETDSIRWAIYGAGVLGDAAVVPWLIERMADERTARLAGEAFSMLTGADLELLDLDRVAPVSEADDEAPVDATRSPLDDSGLPLPDQELVHAWWQSQRGHFAGATRYLLGRPVELGMLLGILSSGDQRQRRAAALELDLSNCTSRTFNVDRRAVWQLEQLRAWNS